MHCGKALVSDLEVDTSGMGTSSNNTQSQTCIRSPLCDDVLSSVFKRVLSSQQSVIPIIRLSHVNQQFRNVIHSDPLLWTDTFASQRRPNMGTINACLKRSGKMPITVRLNIYLDAGRRAFCDEVLIASKAHSCRWEKLYISFVINTPDFEGATAGAKKDLEDLQKIEAPILRHLEIINGPWHVGKVLQFFSGWGRHALRSLVIVHGFPFALRDLTFITSLDLTLSLRATDFHALLKLLSTMSMLLDLRIYLDNHQIHFATALDTPQEVSLVSVRRVQIKVARHVQCRMSEDNISKQIEKAVFRSLHFPNAIKLDITFQVIIDSGSTWTRRHALHEEVNRVFGQWYDLDEMAKRPAQFPRVSHLFVSVTGFDIGDPGFHTSIASLPIPFNIFPVLEELHIKSAVILEPDIRIDNMFKHHDPALRRIQLDVPPSAFRGMGVVPSPLVRWLQALVDMLKARNVFYDFEAISWKTSVSTTTTSTRSHREQEVKIISRDALCSEDSFESHWQSLLRFP